MAELTPFSGDRAASAPSATAPARSPADAPAARGGVSPAADPDPLWLSRLVIDRPLRVRDVYALHQALWKAFAPAEADRCFLFRADTIAATADEGPRVVVLVQSEREPSWTALGGLVADARQRMMRRRYAVGDTLRFFVRANPTACRKGRHEFPELGRDEFRARRGQRVALWRPDDQLGWLHRKAAAAGFRAVAVRTSQSRPWRWSRGEIRARHDGVDFEGVLRVEDEATFARTIVAGIGPAKAFGFGLLSLAPGADARGLPAPAPG